jgi:hypothetical protein
MSWTNTAIGPLEATSDYFIRIMQRMIRNRAKSFDVRQEAQDDFNTHIQEFMKDMVWTGTCRSWCKEHNLPLETTF